MRREPRLIIAEPCPKLPGEAEFSTLALAPGDRIQRHLTEPLVGNEGFYPPRGPPCWGFGGADVYNQALPDPLCPQAFSQPPALLAAVFPLR